MSSLLRKEQQRIYRHKRIRKKIHGSGDRPRLCVHRSAKNLYAQIVDDVQGKVILGMSTLSKEIKGKVKNGGNVDAASHLGQAMATAAQKQGIKKVAFDRGGYLFHGRVKAFAEAARSAGMEF